MQPILIKFTYKNVIRKLIKHNSTIKYSSIYRIDNNYYILITTSTNIIEFNNITILSNNTLTQLELYLNNWAWAELLSTIDFIKFESQSTLIRNGRQFIINNTPIVRTFEYLTDIFAILNYTEDSFSDGGKYNSLDNLMIKAMEHINNGARILDIGVESTNPNSLPITTDEEINKLSLFINNIIELKNNYECLISIDTYHDKTVRWLLDKDVDIINDVSGSVDINLVKEIANTNRKYVAMHSLVVPASRDIHIDVNTNPLEYIHKWMNNKIATFQTHKINLDNIILDVGIGFGLTAIQSWYVLNHMSVFTQLPCEILIGHSRKSFFSHIGIKEPINRDIDTAMVGVKLLNRVDYLRMHDLLLLNDLSKINNMLCFYTGLST